MPYYLVQASYVPAAFSGMIQSPPPQARMLESVADKLGGSLQGVWLAFGEYDLVAICQMPDDESMAAFSMAMSAGGQWKAIKTTPLLSWEEGMHAMERAGKEALVPPGGQLE